jgi:CheY-like chemotaxis protein
MANLSISTASVMQNKQSAKHVLIVDDEIAIAYVFQRYFDLHGFRTSVAYDGNTALVMSKGEPVHAVITDFRMPGMNGQEFISRLRESTPNLPAIIVSAYTNEISTRLPGIRIISKPVDPTYLIASVKEMLSDAGPVFHMESRED